jgi:hypothetical protein
MTYFKITILSKPKFPKLHLPFRSSNKTCVWISHLSMYATRTTHLVLDLISAATQNLSQLPSQITLQYEPNLKA